MDLTGYNANTIEPAYYSCGAGQESPEGAIAVELSSLDFRNYHDLSAYSHRSYTLYGWMGDVMPGPPKPIPQLPPQPAPQLHTHPAQPPPQPPIQLPPQPAPNLQPPPPQPAPHPPPRIPLQPVPHPVPGPSRVVQNPVHSKGRRRVGVPRPLRLLLPKPPTGHTYMPAHIRRHSEDLRTRHSAIEVFNGGAASHLDSGLATGIEVNNITTSAVRGQSDSRTMASETNTNEGTCAGETLTVLLPQIPPITPLSEARRVRNRATSQRNRDTTKGGFTRLVDALPPGMGNWKLAHKLQNAASYIERLTGDNDRLLDAIANCEKVLRAEKALMKQNQALGLILHD